MWSDAHYYSTLTAMITPAIFLTANASLIISTSNRLSRVIDRVRTLNEHADTLLQSTTLTSASEERLRHTDMLLGEVERRSHLLRIALTMLYVSLGTFVATSLSVALDLSLGHVLAAVPTILAVTGVSFMFAACVFLITEAGRAVKQNHSDIAFYRERRSRRVRSLEAMRSTQSSA